MMFCFIAVTGLGSGTRIFVNVDKIQRISTWGGATVIVFGPGNQDQAVECRETPDEILALIESKKNPR